MPPWRRCARAWRRSPSRSSHQRAAGGRHQFRRRRDVPEIHRLLPQAALRHGDVQARLGAHSVSARRPSVRLHESHAGLRGPGVCRRLLAAGGESGPALSVGHADRGGLPRSAAAKAAVTANPPSSYPVIMVSGIEPLQKRVKDPSLLPILKTRMASRKCEFWWLVALEATLFFSWACWESTAPWAEPVTYPLRFGFAVFGAATAAMLACHVGPAILASRHGGRLYPFASVLLLWLSAGYVERILIGAWAVALVQIPPATAPVSPIGRWWLWPAVAFLGLVSIAGLVRSWWRPFAVAGLVAAAGILAWAVVTNWHGLWVRNPYYADEPLQFDW